MHRDPLLVSGFPDPVCIIGNKMLPRSHGKRSIRSSSSICFCESKREAHGYDMR